MKQKMKGFVVLFFVLALQLTFAQDRKITGIVSDNAGIPLPGVSVLVKGTTSGTQTDFDGKYTIMAATNQVLIFSYIGMKTQEVAASSPSLNVKLKDQSVELEGVVVTTALGVKREKKSLGYSSQQISGKDLVDGGAGNQNVANLLSGKAAGVEVSRNTNFGGSTNVVIRGNKSLTGNNQALWVVDGVPIDNSNTNSDTQAQGKGGYDYGNNVADINQEDIESINILKGAAATALYGSRAANGVVMVTTKKGKKGDEKDKKVGFTFSSGLTVGTVDKSTFPTYQNKYGAGYGFGSSFLDEEKIPTVDTSNDASYGDRFDGKPVYQWDSATPYSTNYGKATPWSAAKHGPATFFKNAQTFTNSLSLEKATERSSLSMSYVNLLQDGILPNSELKKNQLSARFSQKITDKLTANAYAAVTLQNTVGRNSTGYSDNIIGSFRQWWQTNVDIKEQQNVYNASGGQNITWNWADPTASKLQPAYWDNPYFTRYQNYSSDNRTRLFSYASLNYEITPWVSALGRVSLDTYKELQEERRAVGSIASGFGLSPVDETSGYQRYDINFQEINYDFMLNFNKKFGDNLSLTGVLGSNIRRNGKDSVLSSTIGGLVTPGIYALSNSRYELPFPIENTVNWGVNGIYAQGSLGYMDTYFIDASIRRDVSSTLPKGNNAYTYPAISGSFLFSNLIKTNWLNLGKFRMNYAEVGNDAEVLSLVNTYTRSSNFNGEPMYTLPNKNKNANLKPERTKSFEVGLEASTFNRRLGFDISYYKTNTVDQIVSTAVSSASGFTNAWVNGGNIENHGFELQLTGTPIKTKDFSWDIIVNWSNNRSKVVSLPEGVGNLQIASFQGGVTVNATLGEAYGSIKGTDYIYTNGQRTVDQVTGKYMMTTSSDNTIGNVTPDWIGGVRNKLKYKNVSMSFLIDTQKGGDIFSLDMYYGLATGLYKETAVGSIRENGIVNAGVAPDGSVNTVPTVNKNNLPSTGPGAFSNNYGYLAAPNKAFIYDASYIKLREVSISYDFPKRLFENTFVNAATLSILGSNLWIISKNLPYADPESGLSSGNKSRGFSTGSLPTTRDIGFNLTFKF
ncbi:SusC/RagA family TonB-linked outer membrane protein [Flavobacterium sp. MC2016-06]|uniref:SusC/RagA family TonB-linked outer membrane protein n=1 Tax=Flavobacterium sp. MC2016-06 TaxID=2676308 RepID=UPI0012BB0946|nr:SusC/RagA family TonB-linked outer membrane protein [Flavobacterium sp. MC2016-06]MBU3858726.1 SusC/RagA family TonB-linked outer membrane protein [Flavobacterium sp. MC2016-06]